MHLDEVDIMNQKALTLDWLFFHFILLLKRLRVGVENLFELVLEKEKYYDEAIRIIDSLENQLKGSLPYSDPIESICYNHHLPQIQQ